MMEEYKGFELRPATYQLTDSKNWKLKISIIKHHDSRDKTLDKSFTGKNEFKTKEEAERNAINFGKQIIDGESPEFTIEDLL